MKDEAFEVLAIMVLIIVGALAMNYLGSGDIENRYAAATFTRCVSEHPDWREADCQRISRQIIWLGMTDEQARMSWLKPKKINRSVGSWGVHEQWVYGDYGRYLYFENGILTSWQN